MDQTDGPGKGTQVEEEAGVLVFRNVDSNMPVFSKGCASSPAKSATRAPGANGP